MICAKQKRETSVSFYPPPQPRGTTSCARGATGRRVELTVCPKEVVEQLEEGEAVPALGRLDLQSGIHVNGVEAEEVFRVLHHEVGPPREGLERHRQGERERG